MTANGSTNDDDYDDGESCFSTYFKTVCAPSLQTLRQDPLNERVMIYETLQWRRGGRRRAGGGGTAMHCLSSFFAHGNRDCDDHAVTQTTTNPHSIPGRQAVQAQFRWPNFKDPIPLFLDYIDQHFVLRCLQCLQKCDSLLGNKKNQHMPQLISFTKWSDN